MFEKPLFTWTTVRIKINELFLSQNLLWRVGHNITPNVDLDFSEVQLAKNIFRNGIILRLSNILFKFKQWRESLDLNKALSSCNNAF